MNHHLARKRIAKIMAERMTDTTVHKKDEDVMDKFQDSLADKNLNNSIDLDKIKSIIYNDLEGVEPKDYSQTLGLGSKYLWGIKPLPEKTSKILHNSSTGEEMYIIEDTFLRSVLPSSQNMEKTEEHYFYACGFILDDLSHYVDATRISRIEQFINSDWSINEDQKKRAQDLIKKIIDNKISKYNNQPILEPKIGREGVKKVLVIDQSYGDYSIVKGMANDKTFEDMLNAAIQDNSDADIIIKTHPDALGDFSLRQKCYYQNTESKGNVYRLTDAINPISLIEYADKVYVCSSQFGFEALMCGKDVYTFGMPFYAGWGLTKDAQKCQRRVKQRTVEEIFYIAYIMFSLYINPQTKRPCEIEEVVDILIEFRDEYFKGKEND